MTGLNDAARAALEALMNLEKFRTETPFYKEGLSQGIAQGREEGRGEGKAESILLVLAVRGLVVSEAHRAAIVAVEDVRRLDELLRRAVTALSVDDLLAE